jgi:two-component system sensor histidine kinase RegB
MPAFPRPADPSNSPAILGRLVVARWLIIALATALTLGVPPSLGISLPVIPMLAVIAIAAVLNLIARHRLQRAGLPTPANLASQLATDVGTLSALLFFSGGATNPFVSLLLPPVAIAALTLPTGLAAGIGMLAVIAYSVLMIAFIPLPIAEPARAARLHLLGMWLTFVLSAALVTWLVAHMSRQIRQRDARLALAREQAMRDGQIIAIGTLAAGTAHELGTPLGTMALIAGELARDKTLPSTIRSDIDVLREQIAACKEIIDRLVQRAGAGRLDHAAARHADEWLAGLRERWHALRPTPGSRMSCSRAGPAPRIIADPRLEQAVLNLLDNAANASGQPVDIAIDWDESGIVVTITDHGPGYPDEVLRNGGQAPLEAHGRGHGIGLLLTRAAVEQLGGRLYLENLPESGARARIELTG